MDASRPLLPFLLILFVGSGACALIYEVVWFQLLELIVGSSAISIGVLLATYMGGMCIGSLALPRFIPKSRHPLRIYAMLELSLGIIGILELFAIPLIGKLYSPVIGHGFGAVLVRGVVAALCLLPPTILMGATLPAIARWLESSTRGVSWLGFFYGGNIVGAVLGSVSAGFYLLRVHDQAYATYVAASLNAMVAALAWTLSLRAPGSASGASTSSHAEHPLVGARAVYIAIGISGACALAAEVVWAVRCEMARTVDDVLSRRLRALPLNARAALAMAPQVLKLMSKELDRDRFWQEKQLAIFQEAAKSYVIK